MTDQTGIEIVVEKDSVSAIHLNKGSVIIPRNGYVLSGSGKYADWLKQNVVVGATIEVNYKLTSNQNHKPLPLENCSYTTAGTVLIVDGERFIDYASEGFEPWFFDGRHPRTAAGISKDENTLWLVVVDGRQPGFSVGMTLGELSDFLEAQGAFNAYNLDGGGSSTMVVKGKVVNQYSDMIRGKRVERRRCDAVLLFEREAA